MTDCHNYSGKVVSYGRNVTLHKLPTKTSTRRAWIRAVSRKYWKPTAYTRVCSDHFKDGIGPNSLQRDKIPTENLAQKTKSTAPKSRRVLFKHLDNSTDVVTQDCNPVLACKDTSTWEQLEIFHGYATKRDEGVTTSTTLQTDQQQLDLCEIGVQSQNTNTFDVNVGISTPEITIEDIKHSDEQIQFYTGLPNFKTFKALYDTLMEFNTISSDLGRKRKLRPVDEFLLVMMRLRLGLLVKDLEYRFKVSSSTVSKIFNSWIVFMYKYLQSLVYLPKLRTLQKRVPNCFRYFSDTRIVLDCTEIFIQTPSSSENKSLTYSSYKSHNTFKVLVGVNMTGAVVFISKLWGGSASDVEITRQSGLLDMLDSGDAVMVDKGFIHLKPCLEKKGVKLYCPPFKTKEQFSKEEVDLTRRIASARIHVERKMEQIKNFRILQGIMPLAVNKMADEIFFVCSALTNLLPPLVS